MQLGQMSAGIMVLVAFTALRDLHAQTDPIHRVFRDGLTQIAVASELPRLDSATLLPGVRREIRIYTGFGLTATHDVVRLVEHTHGVDGQLGVFWPAQTWWHVYSSPREERRARDEERAWDSRIVARLDTAYDCHAFKQTRLIRVCWLPERPNGRVAWAQLLTRLDSLGVDSIQSPSRPEMGADASGIIVEVRTPSGYRVFQNWRPDSASTDPSDRVAAAISTAVWQAFERRLRR